MEKSAGSVALNTLYQTLPVHTLAKLKMLWKYFARTFFWLVAIYLIWLPVHSPLMFLLSNPIEVRVLSINRSIVKRGGYGTQGDSRSFYQMNVQFEYLAPTGEIKRGSCFSTAGDSEEWADHQADFEKIEKLRGAIFVGHISLLDDSVCLLVQYSWTKLLLCWCGSFSCIAIALSRILVSKSGRSSVLQATVKR